MMLKYFNISRSLSGSTLMLVIIIYLQACSNKAEKQPEQAKFLVAAAVMADTAYTRDYVADIHSIQNVEIRARATGYLESIHVDEGQWVKEGQLLFSIGSHQYKQELVKAQAVLASAQAAVKATEVELTTAKTLVEKNIVSRTEQDLAQARYDAALAAVEEAKADEATASLHLNFAQIKAPFNGIINRIPHKAGSLMEDGALLTTISNNKDVFVYFNLSERDYLDYVTSNPKEKSKAASLLLANGAIYPHKGVIETIESEFDKSTGNIAFRARFPNPEQILKHGGSGKVRLRTELKNAIILPQKSTFEIQGNIYVFLIDKSNRVQARKVVPIHILPHLYVISSGLSLDEKFLYEGIQRVREGDIIQPEIMAISYMVNQ